MHGWGPSPTDHAPKIHSSREGFCISSQPFYSFIGDLAAKRCLAFISPTCKAIFHTTPYSAQELPSLGIIHPHHTTPQEMSSHSAIRTFYRKEGKGWHTCKIEGEIACPSFQVVALLREADLWSEWMPRVLGFGVTRTTPLDVTDKTNLALLTHIGFPWPFADRDISIRVDCVDSLDQHPRCVAVLMRDEPDTPINDGVVRCSIQDSGCLLTPYYKGDPEKTYCQFLIRIDVKIDVLPDFIIDGMFKNMSFLLLYQIRNAVKLVSDEKWAERYCHPDSPFYGWLRARIRDSLPEQCTTLPPLREGCNSALKGVDAMLLKSIVGGWISVAAVALIAVARHP